MRRSTKIGSAIVGVGAGIVAALWMLRDRLFRPETSPVTPAEAPAFRVAPPPTAERADADDLSEIKGIGPVFKGRLAAAGISRFDELAATEPDTVAEAAGVTETRAAEWIALARRR